MFFIPDFSPTRDFARSLDANDPLTRFRERFHLPTRPDGQPAVYLCGHSLGLQPQRARDIVLAELDAWASHAVEGHFRGDYPWYTYPKLLRGPASRLVGAKPNEVVFMNGLTINLHLMLATFYRPEKQRYRILLD